MPKIRKYMSHHPDNSPEWYWINGLHDAYPEDFTFKIKFDRAEVKRK